MAQYQHRSNYSPNFTPSPAPPPVPTGTLAPGTIITVGQYVVKVDRFLSEGGFAHVYLATSEIPIPTGSPYATRKHVLKRIAVPDKAGVAEVGKEVEVMKLLRNHPRIVNFIEASFSEIPAKSGGSKTYEIFILMEWCAGGGIIDMMNTRLQNRMTESEILKIFSDVVEAVAHMHYQSPPLIHRDLKVENILLSPPQSYKLCDFGSTTTPLLSIPTAVADIQAMEADINKTTTLQYRAPELMDVWSRKGFDEKIDIWALGVFLYKLCYYTTPFEEAGPLAIINAQYKIPSYPAYSNDIKHMIGVLLQESAPQRPNIFQVHERVCKMRGTSVKIENKYARPKGSLPPRPKSASIPSTSTSASAYSNILSTAPQVLATQSIETVAPMRRGRPARPTTAASISPAPPSSAMSGQTVDSWPAFKDGVQVNYSGSYRTFSDSFTPNLSTQPISNSTDSSQLFADLLPPQMSGRSDTSSKSMAQLTGENELAKRNETPIRATSTAQDSFKISSTVAFTSKSAQTSPHLMANWKPPSPNPPPDLPPLPSSVVYPPPVPTIAHTSAIDLLSDEFDYPVPSFTKLTLETAPPPLPKKTKRLSFIAGPSEFNFESNKAPFRPTPKSSAKISNSLPLSKPIMRSFEDASVRYPSLDEETSVKGLEEKKREEENWTPIVEVEDSSSDEDEVITIPPREPSPTLSTVRSSPRAFTPPPEPISSPQLPIPPKPTPVSPPKSVPVIHAPIPESANRKVAISDLVSQYENRTSENLKSRPPPPTKPINLRRSSITKTAAIPSTTVPIVIESPATPISNRFIPNLPLRTADRLPFKPVAPPSPSGSNSTRPLTRFVSTPTSLSNNSITAKEEEEEEEVAFAGVSSMVNRWQNMGGEKEKRRKEFTI